MYTVSARDYNDHAQDVYPLLTIVISSMSTMCTQYGSASFYHPPLPQVYYSVSAASGTLSDVTPSEGFVSLTSGTSRTNLTLTILSDDLPELEESFTVTITRVEGGAGLDQARLTSRFSIRYTANLAPCVHVFISPVHTTLKLLLSITEHKCVVAWYVHYVHGYIFSAGTE